VHLHNRRLQQRIDRYDRGHRPPAAAGIDDVDDEKEDAVVRREREAWELHQRRRPHDVLDQFRYNDFLQIFEPRLERISRRRRNAVGEFENVSEILHHPIIRHLEDTRLERLEKRTALGEFRGTRISLGTHIQLKLQPATIYCHIEKNVQETALRILAKRIKEHSLAADTRITKQHGPRGKYKYYLWLRTSEMQKITVEELYERLVKLTKTRTIPVTIIIKQSIQSGPIHDIWNTNYSLL